MNFFRYIITSCFGLVASILVNAQNRPDGSVRQTATPIMLPAAYTNTLTNYVRTWEPDMPLTDTTAVIAAARKIREVKQSTLYYDGLGRLQQAVTKGISYLGRDMVAPVVYDAFGREQYQFLPYVQKTGNSNDGKFKTDPFNAQKAFYTDTDLNPGMAGESIFYAQTEFEASPLNRTQKAHNPGNSWSNNPSENKYLLNTDADSVRIWNISNGIPISTSTYAAGELYKQVLINEDKNQTIIFKDKENKVVLQRVQQSAIQTAHIGWLCTYYVYDNLGRTSFIIPPMATEYAMINNWSVSSILKELCFSYQFDDRNRIVVEERPGSGTIYKVYDARDRVAFTQDAEQRKKSPMEWFALFYDALDRPVMTAIYKNSITRESLQANMNTAAAVTSLSYQSPLPIDLGLYDDDGSSRYAASNSIVFMPGFDSKVNAEFVAEIDDGNTNTSSLSLSYALPGIAMAALTPLTYLYYDDYMYPGKLNFVANDFTKLSAADTLYPETFSGNYSTMTNGLATGFKVRILGTDTWLTTTTYYDDKSRAIQVVSDNSVGGRDILTSLYSFKGTTLANYLRHQNPKSITPQTTILKTLNYDHGHRLTSVKVRLNDDLRFERTIVSFVYDELSQISKKRLGINGSGTPVDSMLFTYNIRGWLNGINRDFVQQNGSAANWFGETINYDYGFATNYFNGNIAGKTWKSRSDGIPRVYGYTYEKSNRLSTADFFQQNVANAAWTNDKMDFSVSSLTYDANGGITTLKQIGMNGTAREEMDNLTYKNIPNTNKLRTVTDANTKTSTTLGDFINGTNTGDDYSYDGNGNMTSDLNKNITSITYNHLNLPTVITTSNKGTITYQYDALGNKVSKTVVNNSSSPASKIVTSYSGGFIYKQDSLELIQHDEGRIRPLYMAGMPVSYAFDYFERDLLGSVRLVLTDQPDSSAYAASMEITPAMVEVATFSNIEETRVEKPVGYPQSKSAQNNDYVAKLNGKAGGRKIGPSLVLKVMAGDTVQISSDAFYKMQGPDNNTQKMPVEDMVMGLVNAFGANSSENNAHGGVGLGNVDFTTRFYNNDYQRLKERDADNAASNRPKAYLNFVLFDDQFRMVRQNSGARQVKATSDELQKLTVDKMVMENNGFLYVYTANEAPQDVYFDNLQVLLINGPVLEETHYYPFGLTMEAISSTALKGRYAINRSKFNGIESTRDLGLNQYDAFYRNYDPQIGRWWELDPKPVESISSYAGMYNNPVIVRDFLGDTGMIGTRTLPVVTINGVNYNKETLIKILLEDWQRVTGLKLSLNKNGMLRSGGVRTNKGISLTARKEIKKLLGKGTVYIDFAGGPSKTEQGYLDGRPNEDQIYINPEEVEALYEGTTSDLVRMTNSIGMAVFHEMGHTFLHGNFEHGREIVLFGFIDETDIRVNQIRRELGPGWGQRLSYTAAGLGLEERIGDYADYIPMTKNALNMLNRALLIQNQIDATEDPKVRLQLRNQMKLPTKGITKF